VLRRERDPAQDDRVGTIARRPQLDGWNRDAQHLGHLGMRERGADAAPDTAAEGQP
jgi:hypothetical protein